MFDQGTPLAHGLRAGGLFLVVLMSVMTPVSADAQVSEYTAKVYAIVHKYIRPVGSNDKRFAVLLNTAERLDLSQSNQEAVSNRLAKVVENCPEPSWIFKEGAVTIPEAYRNILDNAEFDTKSFKSETQAGSSKELAENLRKLRASELELTKIMSGGISDTERTRIQKLLSDIRAQIHGKQFDSVRGQETAKARAFDPIQLRKEFQQYSGPEFLIPIKSWEGASGWAKLKETLTEAVPTLPALSVGPLPNEHRAWIPQALDNLTDSSKATLAFEIKLIDIDRYHITFEVFESEGWHFKQGHSVVFTDGAKPESGNLPKGVAPIRIKTLILARNVNVRSSYSEDFLDEVTAQIASKKPLIFGNFPLADKVKAPFKGYYQPSVSPAGIYSPEVFLLGFDCYTLDKSPAVQP